MNGRTAKLARGRLAITCALPGRAAACGPEPAEAAGAPPPPALAGRLAADGLPAEPPGLGGVAGAELADCEALAEPPLAVGDEPPSLLNFH